MRRMGCMPPTDVAQRYGASVPAIAVPNIRVKRFEGELVCQNDGEYIGAKKWVVG